MSAPTQRASGTTFADPSFDEMNFGYSQAAPGPSNGNPQTTDFSAAQAFFGGFQGPSSPLQYGNGAHSPLAYGHAFHPGPSSPSLAMSGFDPISKLGFTSNRNSPQEQFGHNGFVHPHSPPQPFFPNHHHMPPYHFQYPHPPMHPSPPGYPPFQPAPHPNANAVQQRNDDAARRTAEVERRNRLREEEKARRTSAIQKQVDDGMAALKLDKDDAAHRTAEVERRNKQREQEKEKRRLAIQKQVEDGVKAIELEKERERERIKADRLACRKWLSDLSPSSASSSSIAAEQTAGTVDLYAAVGRQLRGFWEESRPAASAQAHRNEVIADVQQAIDRKWPGHGLQVAAFGSSVTGLATESSDLDLVLLDPTRPYGVGTPPELRCAPQRLVRQNSGMPEWYSTNQVANAIRNSGKFKTIFPISGASVPIVKMVHRKHDIPADININERFGLFNSQLIQAYADLQPQLVRPLIFFLKHWYSRCELNDPAGKHGSMSFSSYTIALMALQVLQIQGVLPNLQSPSLLKSLNIRPNFLYARFKRVKRSRNGRPPAVEDETPALKYNVTFATSDAGMQPYTTRALQLAADDAPTNDASTKTSTDRLLGRMLVAFVRFYTQLDRRTQVVSVLNGSPLPRSKGSHPRHILFDSASEDDKTPGEPVTIASRDAEARAALREEREDIWAGEELVVQDPFIVDRNTSRNIKAVAIDKWQTTMETAFTLLGLQKGPDGGEAHRVRLDDAPLVLDLCIPSSLRAEAKAIEAGPGPDKQVAKGEATEPWRLLEETAAQQRELTKQAAQKLSRDKKRARGSKGSEARRLLEEATMAEDMIDGIQSGRASAFTGAGATEVSRLRPDGDANSHSNAINDSNSNDTGRSEAQGLASVPFTFSVSKEPALAVAPTPSKTVTTNGDAFQQLPAGEASRSPTVSTKTDGSSESEDIDLVALRLEQTKLASP
ncbi:uncharacterized protein SRS1_12213 [Sporisorium reilianum f. sp. reilianum]|uniref:Poly(A) RNA polymerase mitochondrial-like central palm domain-containing protein n=1 Tax=Sporisorium reilianum f. sp. reilianum TaxID=72559 RepID=A0A2N8U7F0_9BASI|nr:uncharacterized protein SRS1_12213 [Sporisorium reilianum f. sp. reilianum]